MPLLSDLMDGDHLDRLDRRQREDNLAWMRSRLGQPSDPVAPLAAPKPATPEQADGWWTEYLATTGADVADVLTRGLTLGIIQGKHLPLLGSVVERYATPDERKSVLRKVGEFGLELLAGAVTAGPLLGPVGRAAAGLVPTAGKVVAGAVRAGAEGAALGAAQAGSAAIRGEETPLGAAEKIGGGLVLGGLLGGAMGKIGEVTAARARGAAKEAAKRAEEAAARRNETVADEYLAAKQQPTPEEMVLASEERAAQAERTAAEVAEYNRQLDSWAAAAKAENYTGAVEPPLVPPSVVRSADPKELLAAAERLEAAKSGFPEATRPVIEQQVGDLRQLAVAAQASDAALQTTAEVTALKEWAGWRQALISGGMTGNIEEQLPRMLGSAMLGGLVGGTQGETTDEHLRNALLGAGLGAVAPPLLSALLKSMRPKVAALAETVQGSTVTAPPPATPTPKPQARIRIAPVSTEEAQAILTEAAGATQQAGGFVFHVPYKEWFQPGNTLEGGLAAFSRALKTRVGAERLGPIAKEVREELASKLGLDFLLSKSAAEGWNRFEVTGLGMALRAADDEFWRLLAAARPVNGVQSEAALREFKNQSGMMLALTRKMMGVTSEWGYTGQALQEVQDATPAMRSSVKMISQLLGMDSTEAQLKLGVSPKRWHDMMLALAEEKGKTEKLLGWGTFTKQVNSGLMEAWINGLLSNPATHAANILGNIGPVFAGPAERYLAAKFSSQAVGSVVPGEASEMLYGLWSGMGDAFKAASRAFRSGVSAWDALATKVETPRANAISNEAFGIERGLDTLGTIVRTPGRALTAADDFFKMLNYRMQLHALTYRAARMAHPEGGEAFTTALGALRADPTLEILEQAARFADTQTFTAKMGDTGNFLLRLSNSNPLAKIIMPFVKTPINLVKFAWERTPGLNLLNAQVRADLMTAGASRELALAKMSLGGMVAGTAGVLAAAGYLTGAGPSDKTLKQNLEQTGWQPYSMKIGDTYYAFSRLDPIGMFFGTVADFSDLAGHLQEPELTSVAQALVLSVFRTVTSRTWVQGVSNALEAVTDQDGRYLQTFFNLQGKSLVPSFVAAVNRSYVDPEVHEVHSILDAVRSRVPGFSASLPPRRNLWGDPILLEGGLGPDIASPIYTRTVAGDKVAEEIAANRMRVALPSDYLYGTNPPEGITAEQRVSQGIALTPQQHDRLVLLGGREVRNAAGQNLKESLQTLMESPEYREATDGPDGGKAAMVSRTVQWYQTQARTKLLEEDPALAVKVSRRRAERVAARTGAILSTLAP